MKKIIRLYSLSTCPVCKATKKLLKKCEVQYEYTDLDLLDIEGKKAMIEEVKIFNPAFSFPTLVIDEEVIVGYKEKKILEALGLTQVPKTNILKTLFLKIRGAS
jgi:glutaredoxin-like protein NrdH